MKIAAITPDKKHDYLASTILEGLNLLGHEIKSSAEGNGVIDVLNDNDFIKYANSSDVVLVIWGKVKNNNPPKYDLLNHIDKTKLTAFIDGSEWTQTAYPNHGQIERAKLEPTHRREEPWLNMTMLKRVDKYFKRECYSQDISCGVIPLPFGVMKQHQLSSKQRKLDVLCCFGQLNDGLRKSVTEYCKSLNLTSKWNVKVCSNISHSDYVELLQTSRIVIDAWGGGDCNARFWEAVGCGACVLYQRYNIVIPNPYIDWKHAVSYSTLEEFKTNLNILLENDELLDRITKQSVEHTRMYHTSIARANYLLEKIHEKS